MNKTALKPNLREIPKEKPFIPHYRISATEEDIEAVRRVVASGYWAQGKYTGLLEKEICRYFHLEEAVAVASGTMALVLLLKALNVGEGKEVIIPSYTCTALWHAVKFVGATPVFADCDLNTGNLEPEEVIRKTGRNTAAVVFPHMFGYPGKVNALSDIHVPLIEDIAQSIGAEIGGKKVGVFGDASVLSFYATKPVGAGEGGAVTGNSSEIIDKIKDLREYDQKDSLTLRFNAKISDIHAALALSRFRKLDEMINNRKKIHLRYRDSLAELPFRFISPEPDCKPNYYRCIGVLEKDVLADFLNYTREKGVIVRRPIYRPIHLYYSDENLPNTEYLWKRSFSLPCFPGLSLNEQKKVIETVRGFFGR